MKKIRRIKRKKSHTQIEALLKTIEENHPWINGTNRIDKG
jgi:hypothetical protein